MILIGLGANLDGILGTPEQALRACVMIFRQHGFPMKSGSHIWKTAPVPVSNQPWYTNAVCEVETEADPADLLLRLKRIEIKAGRLMHEQQKQNAPRVMDLDLLAYRDVVLSGDVVVPHPRLQDRAFVLYPLQEIAPFWRHPVLGKSVEQMIVDLPEGQELEKVAGDTLL